MLILSTLILNYILIFIFYNILFLRFQIINILYAYVKFVSLFYGIILNMFDYLYLSFLISLSCIDDILIIKKCQRTFFETILKNVSKNMELSTIFTWYVSKSGR